jgi:Tol biopolymer transport system component
VFGLGLIVSFSLGLAVILIVIGLLIVQGKRLFERLRWFNQASLVMPVFSALIVLGAGGFLTASAIENIQGSSRTIASSRETINFDISDARVIYSDLDDQGLSQLYLINADGAEPEKITSGPNVWSYQVSPDRTGVIYATDNQSNGSQLWSWDQVENANELLYECLNAYCSEITWSPDGQGILYSRLDFDPEINPGNVQTIWWLDLKTAETAPLFQDIGIPGFSARWSPNGEWISYSSINPLEIKIYQMQTGEYISIPNSLGYPAAWSPDSSTLILLDVESGEGGHLTKLFSYSLADEWQTMLAVEKEYDESIPAWSPDGQWLAVVRRTWVDGLPEEGNQLWVMRPDGSDASQLTNFSQHNLGALAWSPDSRYLVFSYRNVQDDQILNGIKILDLQREKIIDLVDSGSDPDWIIRPE